MLAKSLPQLSLDVLGVVACYALCGPACSGVEPQWLFSFGCQGKGDGQFMDDNGCIACSPDGNVWVSDNVRVQVFANDGRFLFHVNPMPEWQWHDPTYPVHLHRRPCGIAFDANASIAFISDWYENRIGVYTLDGIYLHCFGKFGHSNGQFAHCSALAVVPPPLRARAHKADLLVLDRGNRRIQALKKDGKFVRAWRTDAEWSEQKDRTFVKVNGKRNDAYAKGMALATSGDLFVTDFKNNRIQVQKAQTNVNSTVAAVAVVCISH